MGECENVKKNCGDKREQSIRFSRTLWPLVCLKGSRRMCRWARIKNEFKAFGSPEDSGRFENDKRKKKSGWMKKKRGEQSVHPVHRMGEWLISIEMLCIFERVWRCLLRGSRKFANFASALQFLVDAYASSSAILALTLHSKVLTQTSAVALFAVTFAPPVHADAASSTFLTVAPSLPMNTYAASAAVFAFASDSTMLANADTVAAFAAALLYTMLANAATAA
jgi:hypothetical protein